MSWLDTKIQSITERYPELRESILDTLSRWHEPHRHWHGISHLTHCVERSMEMYPEYDRIFCTLVSLYHDAVYDPTRSDNEEASAELVPDFSIVVDGRELTGESIRLAVLQTKEDIHTAFNRIDRDILKTESLVELLEYEKGIFLEFQHCALSDYVKGRCNFLRGLSDKWITDVNRNALIEYVTKRTYRIGIYAGSFDPFHVGHNNIRLQAEKHFDKVVVALGTNGSKSKSYNPYRLDNARSVLPHTQVLQYNGVLSELCTDYMLQAENVEVTLVRGLRNITDLQSEQNLRAALNDAGGVKTMYFICDAEHQHVSSSLVRELRSFGRSADEYLVK